MSSPSFFTHDDHTESSSHVSKPSTGLTFVLPPLSALKAQKTKKKIKLTYEEPVKKQPRPIKLKPLKEVLSRLIAQIKKKDDYAFFLQPVDPTQVPGYSDVISKPMDLGTMTTKVERGKYRSLEEFASDLQLVTNNAKAFNPPGTIYHTEADRIEKYGLDHIAKASSTVIEYETDWNIDVQGDDDPVAIDDDDGATGTPMDKSTVPGTPMDVDESRAGSPSLASLQQLAGGKRKGKKPTGISESLEPDGGLPGAKDGLGAFPPGSDFAELMLALKLKGKRYRTKKERMRMEKGGPPIAADGSLDYPEMEDPFSVLSALVPDPPSRPVLAPLFPTLEPSDPSQPPFPAPVSIFPAQPEASTSSAPATATSNGNGSGSNRKVKNAKPAKRRHWVINRAAPSRRTKDAQEEDPTPAWKTPREAVATDFGSFATLPHVLAVENGVQLQDVGAELGSEEKMFGVLRGGLERAPSSAAKAKMDVDVNGDEGEDDYWTGRATEADAYIRDVVYGGADGLAYVRSLAEFTTPSEPVQRNGEPPTADELSLGVPLAQWVAENVVDPLTGGRHATLRGAAHILASLPPTPPHTPPPPDADTDALGRQIALSLHTYPAAARALASLRAIHGGKIDLPALIRAPEELFAAEDVWAGKEYRERRRREMDEALARDPEKNAVAYLRWAIAEHREAESGGAVGGGVGVGAGKGPVGVGEEDEGMLAYALGVAADDLVRFEREGVRPKAPVKMEEEEESDEDPGGGGKTEDRDGDVVMKTEDDEVGSKAKASAVDSGGAEEDPAWKKLRMNLLALAKRAPLDQIMKLPPELVPAHLRHIVPTADA